MFCLPRVSQNRQRRGGGRGKGVVMNVVALVGRLTRHPIVRFEGESQAASFTLAVEEPARSERTFTTYVGCTAWGKTAETCSLLNAADMVPIVGKLAWTKRTGKCGQEHSVLNVAV